MPEQRQMPRPHSRLMSGDYFFDLLTDNNNSGDDASGGVGFEMNSRVEHTPDTRGVRHDRPNEQEAVGDHLQRIR